MYEQVLDPVGNSLGLSSLFAVTPLLALFILLGALKMKAQWASLIALAIALLVALVVYEMPVGQGTNSAPELLFDMNRLFEAAVATRLRQRAGLEAKK